MKQTVSSHLAIRKLLQARLIILERLIGQVQLNVAVTKADKSHFNVRVPRGEHGDPSKAIDPPIVLEERQTLRELLDGCFPIVLFTVEDPFSVMIAEQRAR